MKKILLLICCFAIAGLGYANKVAYQLTANPDNAKQLIVSAVPDVTNGDATFSCGDVVVLTNRFLSIRSIENTTGSWNAAVNVVFMGKRVFQFHAEDDTNVAIDGTTELFRITFNSARAAQYTTLLNQADHLNTTSAGTSTIDAKLMEVGVQHTAALKTNNLVDGTAFNGVLASSDTPNTPVAMSSSSKTSIFPNPSSGETVNVTIETEATEDVLVQVQSLDGKVVYNLQTDLAEGFNTFELDLTDLTDGIYMLTVNGERTNHIQQLAIVK